MPMLTTDYDLKQSELQQIASADAVVGLFTALGYDTSQRIVQVPAAMGFPEPLAREVVHMERIATHDDNALQVYLVELKHVTVALTQAIARVLKSRAGLFLFALTTRDYEDIDFVLFESLVPEHSKGSKLSSPQVVIRPRILSVDRRNPDAVSLRVLRRFSYTEMDAYYQWDKLRSAYSVAEWSEPLFNNRALFSDYYLMDRLPQRDEWKEEPRSAYQAINKLLVDVREKFSRADEAKVRADLLEPIFRALGWTFEKVKEAKDDGKKADYTLVTSNGKKIPCLAYVWDRSLDGMDEQRDKDTPTENPAQSVVSILEESQGEAKWAIVTNGKTWRLYSVQGQVNSYYEMDLEETLASIEAGIAFRYFWLLFRAKAFSEEPSFVDLLLTESASYAKALGLRLKDKVFDDVFPQFAEGFVKAWGKPAVELTDEELNETFHASLTFLYRMLFLLYAEARDLLPVKETRGYWETSLTRMKKEIAEKAGEIDDLAYEKIKKAYSASETGLYDRLSELFAVIDKGKAELNVPVYNGGLFITFNGNQPEVQDEAEEMRVARFLSSHKIPDRYLAFGLDLLARDIDDKTQALVMIDYKSLGVRQLGSIYEGLLEFKVRVAREKMAVVAAKKGDLVIPYAEAEKDGLKIRTRGKGSAREEFIYRKGEVYLENDNHERKASGSYYTPDFIVKYNVQNTVGPVLEARFEELRPKLREAEQAYHAAQKRLAQFEKMGQKGDDPEKTAYAYRHLVNELFDLRVLDPAMGSGHFLVETVDFITRRLLDFLNAFPWNPVRAALRQTRESILDEMQNQGVSIDPARLTDINLLKRFVLKRCIYGVDLNPMAVELAKVSLWLDCFTLGAPLSFLDHHLRCGNSLIGTNVKTVEETIRTTKEGQLSLYAGPFAGLLDLTSLMVEVVERSDATVADVHSSAEGFGQFRKALEPYKQVLDLWTSQYFDNARAKEFVTLFGDQVMPALKGEMKVAKEYKEAIAKSRESAKEKRFFHWDLEFPEIFVDLYKRDWKQNPGFDAVIGNPPYFAISTTLSQYEINYLKKVYPQIFSGNSDILYYFLALVSFLPKKGAKQGLIVGRYFQEAKYSKNLRNYLYQNANITDLIDFQNFQVFGEEINVLSSVVILERLKDTSKSQLVKVKRLTKSKVSEQDVANALFGDADSLFDVINAAQPKDDATWHFSKNDISNIFEKLRICSSKLGSLATVVQAMQSGRNEVLAPTIEVIKQYNIENQLLYPIVKSGSILRYEFEDTGHLLIWTQNIDINKYPNAKRYLIQFKDDLAIRYDIQNRGANWWEISTPRNAELFFSDKVRILVPFIATGNKFSVDSEKIYLSDGGDIRAIFFEKDSAYSEYYVCALLNSRLLNKYHLSNTKLKRGGYYEYYEGQLSALPIRRIEFSTQLGYRKELIRQSQGLMGNQNTQNTLTFVESRLSATPEEADAVHDLLAYLAEQMIDLNKQKQGEMKRFLTWLEGVLKVSVDEMTGKSKLRNYIGNYQKGEAEVSQEELEDIFYKNKNKLGISLSDARPMAKIRDEYEKSLAVLRPLKESLRWTDGVIDQVVYRLYGLTEDEIKIVEGKAS
jgi:hypothetical protein